jgi:DivIVA domain-containing protein
MPLTPADVANVVFSKPPLGKRGYHEDEVDPSSTWLAPSWLG